MKVLQFNIEYTTSISHEFVYLPKLRIIQINDDSNTCFFSRSKKDQRYIANIVLHEMGHFLVTPPARRKRVDYGIPELSIDPIYSSEEERAQIIENDLREFVGMRKRSIKDNMITHKYWYELEGRWIVKTILDLARSL